MRAGSSECRHATAGSPRRPARGVRPQWHPRESPQDRTHWLPPTATFAVEHRVRVALQVVGQQAEGPSCPVNSCSVLFVSCSTRTTSPSTTCCRRPIVARSRVEVSIRLSAIGVTRESTWRMS